MVSVPHGWRGIILEMLEGLSPYLANNKDMRILQIKRKFGGLRVYHEGFCDMCWATVEYALDMANATCAVCGSRKSVHLREVDGWLTTSCKSCYERVVPSPTSNQE
jgi:uncharacterized protein YihD (DUF1040 family)